jgi:hypothetical protein
MGAGLGNGGFGEVVACSSTKKKLTEMLISETFAAASFRSTGPEAAIRSNNRH